MPVAASRTTRDRLIADATSLADLIERAETEDPQLAASLTPKALAASKTVWGVLASLVISWTVTRYGLAWTPDFCALLSGIVVMTATAILRWITRAPIAGVVAAPEPREKI